MKWLVIHHRRRCILSDYHFKLFELCIVGIYFGQWLCIAIPLLHIYTVTLINFLFLLIVSMDFLLQVCISCYRFWNRDKLECYNLQHEHLWFKRLQMIQLFIPSLLSDLLFIYITFYLLPLQLSTSLDQYLYCAILGIQILYFTKPFARVLYAICTQDLSIFPFFHIYLKPVMPSPEIPPFQFTHITINNQYIDPCSICLNEYEVGSQVLQLQDCKHLFHLECIEKWRQAEKNTCPMCVQQWNPHATHTLISFSHSSHSFSHG